MFKLKVLQAFHGDCLILEGGAQEERYYLLIDGGPGYVYQEHLKKELLSIRDSGGKINLAVLSHVDDDHVNGLLDLLHELIKQRKKGKPETVAIEGLWHNSFSQTIGTGVEKDLARQIDSSPIPRGSMPLAEKQSRSIGQGHDLTASARGLQIPINLEFRDTPDRLVCVDNIDHPIPLANLSIQVIGPTRETLKALQQDWEKWLADQERIKTLPKAEAKAAARKLDDSVPNLSSIMLLVTAEKKTILLTGDGLSAHLLKGLEQAGLLDQDGKCHVNVFKLPHHGSVRNVTAELFEHIIADIYLICANGENENPDYQTLEWLVEAAIRQGRSFTILATTETESIKDLVKKYDPAESSYKLTFIEPGAHSITLDLS